MFEKGSHSGFALMCIIASLLMLTVACGGSNGGGDSVDYDGNREPAEITGDNAQALAVSAYESRSLTGPFGSIASLNVSNDGAADASEAAAAIKGRPAMLTVAQVLEAALEEALQFEAVEPVSARALERYSETINGSCGGSARISFQFDTITGVFSGDIAFNGYCNDGTAIEGSTSIEGRVDPATEALEYFTFSFNSLVGTVDGESFNLQGSMTLSRNASRDRTTITMDLLSSYSAAGETLWLSGFTISVTEGVDDGTPYDEIELSGRIYHAVHGYVDIRTDVAFRIEGSDENPNEGVLVLTGADDARVVLTVISNSQYEVEADCDGDGSIDYGPQPYNWDE